MELRAAEPKQGLPSQAGFLHLEYLFFFFFIHQILVFTHVHRHDFRSNLSEHHRLMPSAASELRTRSSRPRTSQALAAYIQKGLRKALFQGPRLLQEHILQRASLLQAC